MDENVCIRCGCTDSSACAGGCAWRYVNHGAGFGICSACTTHRDITVQEKRRETRAQLKAAVDRHIKAHRTALRALRGRGGKRGAA